jgi:hypothetical protein
MKSSKNKRHGILATGREVYNATRRFGDGSRLMLGQRVRGSVKAVRAARNTRVFQTETRVVADAIALHGTLTASLSLRCQVSSQDTLKHTPEHALKYTPNLT